MRTLSSMIAEVRSQANEVNDVVSRMRAANRRLTGGTGEAPTQLANVKSQMVDKDAPPLLPDLDAALEHLNMATADLRNEMAHAEGYSETGMPTETKGYAASPQTGRG